MNGLPFSKYVSIGNDFVLVEEKDLPVGADLGELAKRMCARNFGIGSDGLLTWAPEGDAARMRMFNPDGTEDFCGNGLRCAALHTKRQGLADKKLMVVHLGRDVDIAFGLGGWIDVGLPQPSFEPADVPLAAGVDEIFDREVVIEGVPLRLCATIVGSTHAVVLGDGPPSEGDFQKVSPVLEHHEWFPERTSVIWSWPLAHNKLRVRIWERGAGETLGCGTGSAATAACWFRMHPILAVEVHNPGGECAVAVGPGGTLVASAKARHVYSGKWLGM
ncbi:MAG: diaminopimelate epimerase [Armatimonadetes bacterium]|nr:diaminopimelate epimerase [Armatimonadota bacterium]